MIHFCNHKKQSQKYAYRRSQRQTAHQLKNKNKQHTSLSHFKKIKRMMLATPRLLHCHKEKMLLRHQIYTEIRHKNLSIASEHQ